MCDFCHLHLHTSISLLDGGIKISDLVKKVKEYGMTSCGVSEHGWLASAVEFYKECKKNGIKPIIGSELYITENEDGLPNENKIRDNHHMVVIAKDYFGYKKLVELVSEGSLNNFYYKPRVYKEKLRALAGHAIFLSGCIAEDTLITTSEGIITIKELSQIVKNKTIFILSFDEKKQKIVFNKVVNAWKTKTVKKLIQIKLSNGSCIKLTSDHKVYTNIGWIEAGNLDKKIHKILDLNIK